MANEDSIKLSDSDVIVIHKNYISVMHGLALILILVVIGLLGGIVWAGVQIGTLKEKVKTLEERNDFLEKSFSEKDSKAKKIGFYIEKYFNVDKQEANEFAKYEIIYSDKFKHEIGSNNEPSLLSVGLAVTAKESAFQPEVISSNNSSFGLKQINFSAHFKKLNIRDREELFNPKRNVELGYIILRDNYRSTGSMHKALQLYYGSKNTEDNIAYADKTMALAKRISVILGV